MKIYNAPYENETEKIHQHNSGHFLVVGLVVMALLFITLSAKDYMCYVNCCYIYINTI